MMVYHRIMVQTYIKGYKGNYSITDDGRVIAHRRKVQMPKGGFKIIEEHEPLLSKSKKGYLRVMLTHPNGTRRGFYVHRLVGLAFIKKKDATKIQINHKDKNKQNNHVSNLEWVTNQENAKHRFDKTKTYSRYYGVTKHKKTGHWQAMVEGKYLGTFKEELDAARAVNAYFSQ